MVTPHSFCFFGKSRSLPFCVESFKKNLSVGTFWARTSLNRCNERPKKPSLERDSNPWPRNCAALALYQLSYQACWELVDWEFKFFPCEANQKQVTLKRVTCNSFPWNKAGDFRTPILCPNMDKNEIEDARAGKRTSYVTAK